MDRRFLTVLGVSLVFALVVSSIFYQMSAKASTPKEQKQVKAEVRDLVVAAKPLGVGTSIKPGDVKVIKVPIEQFPKGAFSKAEDVMERPLISNILLDEPVLEGRLADRGSGLGLAPIIPVGMRAVTVRVNEVVGVAGFVLPGMRVDVLVTGRPPQGDSTVTTTVLQNIMVLSAGQTMTPDARGQAINAPTVTVLVTPDQAETLTLAGNEGRIQLVLRNGSDQNTVETKGSELANLFGGRRAPVKPVAAEGEPRPRVRRTPPPVPVAPAPVALPPAPPPPDEIVTFRGTIKTVEVLGQSSKKD